MASIGRSNLRPHRNVPEPETEDEFVFDSAKPAPKPLKSSLRPSSAVNQHQSAEPSSQKNAPSSSTPRKSNNNEKYTPPEEVKLSIIEGNSEDEVDPDVETRRNTAANIKATAPKKEALAEDKSSDKKDDDEDEANPEEPESSPFSKPKYPWDVFRKVAREQMLDEGDRPQFATWVQISRFLIYVALFFVLLASVLTSRLTFLTLAGSWKDIIRIEDPIIEEFFEVHDGGRQTYQDYCHFLSLAAILTPTFIWFIFGAFRVCFSGSQPLPAFHMVLFVIGLECAHSFGVSLFINRVITEGTNIWKLTSFAMAAATIPSVCGLLFVSDAYSCMMTMTKRKVLNKLAYLAAMIFNIVPFVILATSSGWKEIKTWEFPTSILLISFVWTLNLIFSEPLSFGNFRIPSWPSLLGDLYRVKAKMTVISTFTRIVTIIVSDMFLSNTAVWSMPFISPLHSFLSQNMTQETIPEPYSMNYNINMTLEIEEALNGNETEYLFGNYSVQDLADAGLLNITGLFITHLVSTIVSLCAAALACKLMMQQLAFALPLALTTPLTVAVMLLRCKPIETDLLIVGPFLDFISNYFNYPGNQWYCLPKDTDEVLWVYPTVMVLWYFGQSLAAFHVWFPNSERLAEVEKLFVLPGVCSPFMEQWLLFNRRLNDTLLLSGNDQQKKGKISSSSGKEQPPIVPRIYACATMWHETREEMTELMKSIFRMDKDHAERKRVLETLHSARDPDTLGAASEILAEVNYYEYETHIIFDDSMTLAPDGKGMIPNEYVRTMFDVLRDAGTSVYNRFFELPDPQRIPTPYGGRLIWMLPGGTLLVVHLKDKQRMRHKKRWSQVMYMYYILGYKLYCADPIYRRRWQMDDAHRAKSMGDDEKIKLKLDKLDYPEVFRHVGESTARMAENTFLLTLDGDVDFRASSVLLLLDLMKKSKKVGAACGRIHPIGRGPIVWYQKFEYAIAHWLQKAAEHVFGCVLCTPGCFSLFRGSALMDDNVMRAYATTSTEAAHYVQYDQGEDRWLCTLLLQQGYRAEYSAAADALTHCPESFNEFYQQRRRWGPSTLSNIVDLLSSWRQTVVMNDNFSLPYVAYQMVLLISTLLGPATIIMMIAGAYNAVFHIDLIQAYFLSMAPPAFFLAVCLTCKTETQINTAAILSAIYAVVMLVVIVGTIINGLQESITSPNVIFVMSLFLIFITSAGCHPREFTDLTHGWLYVLCIPAGYLLLTIYSLANMNNVSWGTREALVAPTPDEQQKQQVEEEKKKKEQPANILTKIGVTQLMGDMKDFLKSLAARGEQQIQNLKTSNQLEPNDTLPLLKEMRDLLGVLASSKINEAANSNNNNRSEPPVQVSRPVQTDEATEEEKVVEVVVDKEEKKKELDIDVNYWLERNDVGKGPIRHLDADETDFWTQMIRRYAYPLPDNKMKKEKIAAELKVLRDNVVFGVSMMNFLWIVITFQLQYHQDLLKYAIFVPIPRGDDLTRLEYFEPLGMIFLFFFAVILLIQYAGMLAHRLDTFFHLIAAADLDFGLNGCCRNQREESSGPSPFGASMMSNISAPLRRRRPRSRQPDDAAVVNPRNTDAAGLSRRNRIGGGKSAVSSQALSQANYV